MISRIVNLLHFNMPRVKYYMLNESVRYKSNRPEQKKLRKYLEDNKERKCIICQRKLPNYTLECAHIKPRYLSNERERHDFNIVNWMCRNCHIVFDKGDIGVDNGELLKSVDIEDYDFDFNFKKEQFMMSKDYFEFHFNNIFKK